MKHYVFVATACVSTGIGLFGLAGAIYAYTDLEIYVPLLSGGLIFTLLGIVIFALLGFYVIAKLFFKRQEAK